MAAKRSPKSQGLPSREQILDFVNTAEGKVGKREIARAFGLSSRFPTDRSLAQAGVGIRWKVLTCFGLRIIFPALHTLATFLGPDSYQTELIIRQQLPGRLPNSCKEANCDEFSEPTPS